jgi:hypothetical protein
VLGKTRATRVRRLISWLRRSAALEVRSRVRCSAGKARTVRLSGTLASSQSASSGALERYLATRVLSKVSAWGRVGAWRTWRNQGGEGAAQGELWHVVEGVLLEMELAALPRHAGETGLERRPQTFMIIADDEDGAVQAALLESSQEIAPVHFGLADGCGDTENGTLAVGGDANGHEHGAVQDDAIAADLFIAGIDDEVRVSDGIQAAIAPSLQLRIELGAGPADLSAGDLESPGQLFENGGDLAGGNALDVHLGDGQGQSAFAAPASFQCGRIEFDFAADLRHGDGHFSQAGLEGLGLKAIGVAGAAGRAFVGIGAERLGALDLHGVVEQEAHGLGEAVSAFLQNAVHDLIE